MTDTKKDDIFNKENEVKSTFVSWGKPGDYIVGTLADKRETENNLSDKPGEMQTIYEFKVTEGSFHQLVDKVAVDTPTKLEAGTYWSVGGKKGIDAQMRNVKIGQIVGMKFIEETPAKVKGYNPTKVVKIYTSGAMDTAFMEGVGEGQDEN